MEIDSGFSEVDCWEHVTLPFYYPTRRYSYNEDEKPTLDYNVEEAATLEDLRDFLIYGDYSDLLVIAQEVGHQAAIRRDGPILSLKQ